MSHRGSILCLPSGIYAWPPAQAGGARTRPPSRRCWPRRARSACCCWAPGRRQEMPAADVRRAFAEAGIALEAMDTGAACRTYNVLLAEGRPVGAALLAVD